MKNLIVVVSVVALGLILQSPARAADAQHASELLQALEGSWEGHGLDHAIGTAGAATDTPYTFDLQVASQSDFDGGTVWSTNNNVTTDQGITRIARTDFSVKNGLLFVSSNSGTEPVEVVESTPTSLTYKMRRTDIYTGRTFEFTFHTELKDHDSLQGENTVSLNGVTIEDDRFSGKRW